MNARLINAWIFLNEDEPPGTNYDSPDSCYQRLIEENIYQSVDILFLCFATTTTTGSSTIPPGDGSTWTLEIGRAPHMEGMSNREYMEKIVRDARENNPDIRISLTLDWGDGNTISRIFQNDRWTPKESADAFAKNLMAYLDYHDLDGFDVDWEYPLSNQTTTEEFKLLYEAIGKEFKKRGDKHYYLTLSPVEMRNLDALTINKNVDFINLQLFSGFTSPGEFIDAGVDPELFAYGAKFESDYQTAEHAYRNNEQHYGYEIMTSWRLNSENYQFEQTQQQKLYRLIFTSLSPL